MEHNCLSHILQILNSNFGDQIELGASAKVLSVFLQFCCFISRIITMDVSCSVVDMSMVKEVVCNPDSWIHISCPVSPWCLPSNQVSPQGSLYCLLPAAQPSWGPGFGRPASSVQVSRYHKWTMYKKLGWGIEYQYGAKKEIVSNWSDWCSYEPQTSHEYFALCCSEYYHFDQKVLTLLRAYCSWASLKDNGLINHDIVDESHNLKDQGGLLRGTQVM